MTIGRKEELPPLPEPEGSVLKNHLRQVNINCKQVKNVFNKGKPIL